MADYAVTDPAGSVLQKFYAEAVDDRARIRALQAALQITVAPLLPAFPTTGFIAAGLALLDAAAAADESYLNIIANAQLPSPDNLMTVTAGNDAMQASMVQGFSARYADQRSWLAARSIAIPALVSLTVRAAFDYVQEGLRQARAAAEGASNGPALTYQGDALTYQNQPLTYGAS